MSPAKNTIFFSSFSENILAKDVWQFFEKGGRIKDIILPKRRDRNNNIFGFVLLDKGEDGLKFIASMKGKKLGAFAIYLAFAKKQSMLSTKSEVLSSKVSPVKPSRSYSKGTVHSSPKIANLSPKIANLSAEVHLGSPNSTPSPISFPLNDAFVKELDACLLLKTTNGETPESVGVIVEGLGFEDVAIKEFLLKLSWLTFLMKT